VKAFASSSDRETADANAVGLSLFGKYAIAPLVEELGAGVVKPASAEKGLRLIAADFPNDACARFAAVLRDRAQRHAWQAHQSVIRLMGQSGCTRELALIQSYRAELAAAQSDEALRALAARYAAPEAFDREGAAQLLAELDAALAILRAGPKS